MDTTEKTDRDLLLAFIDGNEAAFNELHCRFRRDVRHVVFKYHTPGFYFEIEDICQHFWTGLLQYRCRTAAWPTDNWPRHRRLRQLPYHRAELPRHNGPRLLRGTQAIGSLPGRQAGFGRHDG